MTYWFPTCADCGADLPERGYRRRRVPRLGGRLRHVCESCAQRIDEQQVLVVDSPTRRR